MRRSHQVHGPQERILTRARRDVRGPEHRVLGFWVPVLLMVLVVVVMVVTVCGGGRCGHHADDGRGARRA